jgi:hypothetical protein
VEQKYRQFVKSGTGKELIWVEVKDQALLGEEEFVDGLMSHIRNHKEVLEVPRSQRYAARPALEKIFKESILRNSINSTIYEILERRI